MRVVEIIDNDSASKLQRQQIQRIDSVPFVDRTERNFNVINRVS